MQDLRLKEEGRELIYKGALGKRGNAQGDSGDLMVFLFDHALLMVKPKSKVEQYKVYRRVWHTALYGTRPRLTGLSRSRSHSSFCSSPPQTTMRCRTRSR